MASREYRLADKRFERFNVQAERLKQRAAELVFETFLCTKDVNRAIDVLLEGQAGNTAFLKRSSQAIENPNSHFLKNFLNPLRGLDKNAQSIGVTTLGSRQNKRKAKCREGGGWAWLGKKEWLSEQEGGGRNEQAKRLTCWFTK